MKFQNKNGFTLMELLVYMAIVGIVVVIAGQVYSDSTKMRVRTQSMIDANETAENVGQLIRTDIAQTGARSARATSSKDEFDPKSALVFMNVGSSVAEESKDSSSFVLVKGANGLGQDKFTFRTIRYNNDGTYKQTEQITWELLSTKHVLVRTCNVVGSDGTVGDECDEGGSVDIAENVETFSVTPAKPSVSESSELLFPDRTINADNKSFRFISYTDAANTMRLIVNSTDDETVSLSGFASNYDPSGSVPTSPKKNVVYLAEAGTTGDDRDDCYPLNIKQDSIYQVSFKLKYNEDASRMYRPGVDYMSVGLRLNSGAEPRKFADLADYIFYPPQTNDGIFDRVLHFSTHAAAAEGTPACVAFTFSFFSPTVSAGKMTFENMEVRRYGQDFQFDDTYTPTIAEKKRIRAVKVEFSVKRNKEKGSTTFIVPIPSNGIKG